MNNELAQENSLGGPPSSVGLVSPLTTKGDLWTYTTNNSRLGAPTTANQKLLVGDTTNGLSWTSNPTINGTFTANALIAPNLAGILATPNSPLQLRGNAGSGGHATILNTDTDVDMTVYAQSDESTSNWFDLYVDTSVVLFTGFPEVKIGNTPTGAVNYYPVRISGNGVLTHYQEDAAQAAILTAHTLQHVTTHASHGAAGIGIASDTKLDNSAGTAKQSHIWRYTLTTATAASEVGKIELAIISAGTLPAAGSGQHAWTPSQYLAPAGSTAAPALSFTSDPDTGIYSTGANELGFSTGNGLTAKVVNGAIRVTGALFTGQLVCGNSDGPLGAGGTLLFKDGANTEIFRVTQNTVQLAAASEAADGTSIVTIGNLGPGAGTISIQGWWRIKESSGNTRYIPLFG